MKSFEMTEVEQKIAVMQAWVDGKSVEVRERSCDKWVATGAPLWGWKTYDYRVKSEPAVAWLVCYTDGYSTLHSQRNAALAEVRGRGREGVDARILKMVEVEE